MKTIRILIFLTASFWLTIFFSNFGGTKQGALGDSLQHVVYKDPVSLPQDWKGECESGWFVFKTISDAQAEIQIVLGLGNFGPNEVHRVPMKLQDLEASNIHPRKI